MLFFVEGDGERPELFDEELPPLDRPPLDVLRDELLPDDLRDEPPDDDELFDLLPDEVLFDLPLEDEPEPLLLDAPELLDELDLPLPPLADFDEPPDLRPADEDDVEDFDRPDELDDRPPELDRDAFPPLLERDVALLPLDERPPLRDDDDRPPVEVIVSAAAPIAPIAAPEAAPVMISLATSMTLSTIADVVLFDRDDLPRDEVDEDDEPRFRELLDRVCVAI